MDRQTDRQTNGHEKPIRAFRDYANTPKIRINEKDQEAQEWIFLAQDMDSWWDVMDTITNILFLQIRGIL